MLRLDAHGREVVVEVNGIDLYVEDSGGDGPPVCRVVSPAGVEPASVPVEAGRSVR
jgi:hypothetical protein